MKQILFLFFLILLVGCSGTIEKKEVIAILNDKEITAEDVLKQYPLEKGYIENYLKHEVIIAEAKSMGITVTDEEVERLKKNYYPTEEFKKTEKLHEKQATTLGISTEEFFDIWVETYLTKDAYINKYIKRKFKEPKSKEEAEQWGKDIENDFNKVYESYKRDKKLIIK